MRSSAAARSPHARSLCASWARSLLAALAAGLAAVAGCSAGDELALPAAPSALAGGGDEGPCVEGEERACSATVAMRGRTVTCRDGTQRCVAGAWGDCDYSSFKTLLLPSSAPGLVTRAITEDVACLDNVCDPGCRVYYEVPPEGPLSTPPGESIFTWGVAPPTVNLAELKAGGVVKMGFEQPCASGFDCQFNYRCTEAVSGQACAHSKCEVGVALDPTCEDEFLDAPKQYKSTCVRMICDPAVRPSCCEADALNACGQDPCATGPALKPCATDPCVEEVCTRLPDCCGTAPPGSIIIEAEDFSASVARAGMSFLAKAEAGASGAVGMYVPDAGKSVSYSDVFTKAPQLDYEVTFAAPGRWYVWVRGRASKTPTSKNDRIHLGLDGHYAPDAVNIESFGTSYAWGGSGKYLTVPNDGNLTRTVHLFMGEDGFIVDELIFSQSSSAVFVPKATVYAPTTGAGVSAWSDACIEEYESVCGVDCGGGGWTQECVDLVEPLCGATCGEIPDALCDSACSGAGVVSDPACVGCCSHSPCASGEPLAARCHPCVEEICKTSPLCCISGWTSACVDMVASTCALDCATEAFKLEPVETGRCVPWRPGQVNEACAGKADLSLGIPCQDEEGTLQLPICNHGATVAPAGLRVISYPAASSHYPSMTPTQKSNTEECPPTTEAILPGHCINLPCALGNPADKGIATVMVNPAPFDAGDTQIEECSLADNWTIYTSDGIECVTPVCVEAETSASFRKVHLYFQVDKSSSMSWNSRWTKTAGALKTFFASPDADGLDVALEFFPLAASGSQDGCGAPNSNAAECTSAVAKCSNPIVPFGLLTAAAGDAQEVRLNSTIDAMSLSFGTPTFPALSGAVAAMSAARAAAPGDIHAVVLATDGAPSRCVTDRYEIAKIALDGFVNHGVLTYVIGMSGADFSALDLIAQAGGTRSAIDVSDDATVESDLVAALSGISRSLVSCEFEIENGEYIDPASARVEYTPGSGGEPIPLPRVSGAAQCGAGWYYDDPLDPTRATLCPATCAVVQGDPSAKVSVRIDCAGPYQETSVRHIYEASCPEAKGPYWTTFTWDTAIDPGAEVLFEGRVAPSEAELAGAEWIALGTATETLPRCGLGGPIDQGCPRILFDLLAPDPREPFLEVRATLLPTEDGVSGATLKSWEVGFTCVDNE